MKHIFILIVPIISTVCCAVQIILDINRLEVIGDQDLPAIAHAEAISGDVKRKISTRLIWFDLQTTQDLYPKESIRTASDSTAIIKFEDGGAIELSENSLVVLERVDNSISIDFVSGNILTRGGNSTKLILKSKDLKIDVTSGAAKLSSRKGGKVSVTVKDGNVTAWSDKNKINLKKNQQALLTKDLKQVKTIPFELISPRHNSLVLIDQSEVVLKFDWKVLRKIEDMTIVIATNDKFDDIVEEIEVKEKRNILIEIEEGKYYWRLKTTEGLISDFHKFEVKSKDPIQLLEPTSNKIVKLNSDPHRQLFKWIGPDYYNKYILEISNSPLFKSISVKKIIKNSNYTAIDLSKEGKFYWRVRGISSRANSENLSITRTISLLNKEPLKLLEPSNKKMIEYITSRPEVDFQWKWDSNEEDEGSKYILELSSDINFTKIINRKIVKLDQTKISLELPMKRKKYFYRISVNDKKERTVTTSYVNYFKIRPKDDISPPQLNFPPNNFLEKSISPKDVKLSLEWSKIPNAKSYETIIYQLKNGRIPAALDDEYAEVKQATKTQQLITNLIPNTYMWSVRGIDKYDRKGPLGKFRLIHIKKQSELLPPPEMLDVDIVRKKQ